MKRKSTLVIIITGLILSATVNVFAQESTSETAKLTVAIDTLWVMLAGMLVFFMNTGFAMVETGLTRSKNAVNILTKNFIVFAIASMSFWIIGWGLMFGNGNGFIGTEGLFLLSGTDNSPATGDAYSGAYSALNWTGIPLFAKYFFQLVFAATAATIVSGAVAERIKIISFILFSFILVSFLYPVTGHWIWGGGWLASLGMYDFAGSTVVHSVGGWAALAGVLVLGARTGKYRNDGSVNPIFGHNMSLATLGAFILWLGWFGFNPGSTMSVGDGTAIAHVALTTNTIIGLISGVLVVLAVMFFDKIKIDDPVGALSVHLVNGVFGTLCVGLFAENEITGTATGNGLFFGGGFSLLLKQLAGVAAVGLFTFVVSYIVWIVLAKTIGIRVSVKEEINGLDLGEHGIKAYPDFQSFLTK